MFVVELSDRTVIPVDVTTSARPTPTYVCVCVYRADGVFLSTTFFRRRLDKNVSGSLVYVYINR